MLNYSQDWGSFPAYAPRDGRRHFYSWKSILDTLGDLIMASGIAADVTRCSVDGGFQQHCGPSILGLSLPPQCRTAAVRVISPGSQGALTLPSVSAATGQVMRLMDSSALPPSLLAVSLGSESLFNDYDDGDKRSRACWLILT